MSLKQLSIEEEPEQVISYVPLASSEETEPDPELPGEFLAQDDLDLLQDSATALETIGVRIACEGMDLSTARELEKLSPGFMRQSGGHNVFTSRPSLEGLSSAVTTVKDRLVEIIQRVRKYVAEMYKRFMTWLIAKFAKPDTQEFTQELNDFFAARRNTDAIKYLDTLPEEPSEAAAEIARLMDGDTATFASALTDQLGNVVQRMAAIEEAMQKNPTHYRLARGVISVQELFKEDANSAINALLKKAVAVADAAMKTRTADQFGHALAEIEAVTAEMDEFEKGMVVNTEASSEHGDDKGVPLSKLMDNINKVAKDMERVSIQQQVKDMTATLKEIIRVSEETKIEEILEMIPEDVPAEKQNSYAQKIASLYRRIAGLGANILRLWKVRADSVTSINQIGNWLLGLVDGFEKSVVAAGSSLTVEQRAQVTKALANKGFKIVF